MQAAHTTMARGGLASASSRPPVPRVASQRFVRGQRLRHGTSVKELASQKGGRMTAAKGVPSSLVYDPSPYERELQWQANCMPLRLVLPKEERRACLESRVHDYFDCWNTGTTDSLDEVVEQGVTYSDVLHGDCDHFGRGSLKSLVGEFAATHPLLHFEVEDIFTDPDRDTAVAHWHATSADLISRPGAGGRAATGAVETISGVDRFRFSQGADGLKIRSILSYRARFAGEDCVAFAVDGESAVEFDAEE